MCRGQEGGKKKSATRPLSLSLSSHTSALPLRWQGRRLILRERVKREREREKTHTHTHTHERVCGRDKGQPCGSTSPLEAEGRGETSTSARWTRWRLTCKSTRSVDTTSGGRDLQVDVIQEIFFLTKMFFSSSTKTNFSKPVLPPPFSENDARFQPV